jgi:cell division protein FtsQ
VNATSISEEQIDPRIRARRVEVIREQGRRRLRVLLVSVSVLCVVGLGWLVIQSPVLAVRHVDVAGAHQVSAADVRAAAHVGHGAALVTLDRGAIARRVGALPWVAHAAVTKHLPGTVRIMVTERTPSAWARARPGQVQGGDVALIDSSARVLAMVGTPPDGLPELVGIGPLPRPGARVQPTLLDVRARLGTELGPFVTAITASPNGVSLRLVPGSPAGEIRLGPPDQLTAQTDAVLALLRGLGGAHVHYIDVSVPQAPATG